MADRRQGYMEKGHMIMHSRRTNSVVRIRVPAGHECRLARPPPRQAANVSIRTGPSRPSELESVGKNLPRSESRVCGVRDGCTRMVLEPANALRSIHRSFHDTWRHSYEIAFNMRRCSRVCRGGVRFVVGGLLPRYRFRTILKGVRSALPLAPSRRPSARTTRPTSTMTIANVTTQPGPGAGNSGKFVAINTAVGLECWQYSICGRASRECG